MHYYEVAIAQIFRPNAWFFTYASDKEIPIGTIVKVEVGKKQATGLIFRAVDKPEYATKPVTSLVDDRPIPLPLMQLSVWLSEYYATHMGLVLQALLPRGIDKKRRQRTEVKTHSIRDRTTIVFTPEQQAALLKIESMQPGSALLHGVTGSGKTAIYIELAKRTIAQGKSAVVLVPEIALTSQLVDEFSHHFETILLTHSRQTEAERHLVWQQALHSTDPVVVIGPRSALFLPVSNIGLIVIDEAHEPSFKQEQSPRYSALRAASILSSHHQAKLILGSATPSIADYYLADKSGRPIIRLTKPARPTTSPSISLVDMTKRQNFKQHRFLSDILIAKLQKTFDQGDQALIFHNRRGSASSTLCENCSWQAICPRCFIPLTLHGDRHHLRCHVCGLVEKVPTSCPVCHHAEIIHKGIGTKRIEEDLRRIFPNKSIVRFDGDNESGQSVEARYAELYSGAIDLIIGTQVIAKGLDLPKLRTVGVVQADAGLSLPDFGSSERTFQLLAQVVGRVGRSHHKTDVIVQSYQPTHLAVVDGLSQNYEHFYANTLPERQRSSFPPFVFLLKLTCIYKTEAAAIKHSQALAQELQKTISKDVTIFGPAPAFYERQHDTYRWQLVLKSHKRQLLVDIIKSLPPAHWQFELDPVSLL